MSNHIVAITTIGSEDEAVRLAKALVARQLVACVNVLPQGRSVYRWKGEIEDDREHVLFMKTRREAFSALEDAIRELHPYDVPELICLPVELGSEGYLRWIDENTQVDDRSR